MHDSGQHLIMAAISHSLQQRKQKSKKDKRKELDTQYSGILITI